MISHKCECVPANQVYLYIGEAKHVLCWNVLYNAVQCGKQPPKLPLPTGDPCSDLTCGFLGPPKSTAQTACRSDKQFVYMSTAHCKLSLSLWWGGKCPRDSPFPWGSGPTPNTWFTWPTWVFIPNCMLTGSAISLRLTIFLPYILQCDRTCPPKIAPYPWGIGPSPNTWFLGPTQVKWYFDWFSRYCGAHVSYRQTDRHTEHATSIAIGRTLCSV